MKRSRGAQPRMASQPVQKDWPGEGKRRLRGQKLESLGSPLGYRGPIEVADIEPERIEGSASELVVSLASFPFRGIGHGGGEGLPALLNGSSAQVAPVFSP